MIKNVYITQPPILSSGKVLTLNMNSSGQDEGLVIFNIDGLGPPKATISAETGPNTDGSVINAIKTDPRHMVITLAVANVAGISEEEIKQKIYDYFQIKQEIKFRVESDTKDVYTLATVEQVEFNQFNKIENVVISLYSPVAWWQNQYWDQNISILSVGNGGTTIPYVGDIPVGLEIVITINNNLSDLSLVSIYTDTAVGGPYDSIFEIDLYPTLSQVGGPSSLLSGDEIRIDTRYGTKSVKFWRGSSAWNVINGVTLDETTYKRWSKLYSGSNEISFDCAWSPDEFDISIVASYRAQFQGV